MLSRTDDCRAAIRAGDYGTADRLLAELRTQVEEAWPAASHAERQSIAGEVLELLSWARKTALARRSHAQKRLRDISHHSAYLPGRVLNQAYVDLDG